MTAFAHTPRNSRLVTIALWYIRLQHETFNSRNYPALIYPAQAAREKLYLRLAE